MRETFSFSPRHCPVLLLSDLDAISSDRRRSLPEENLRTRWKIAMVGSEIFDHFRFRILGIFEQHPRQSFGASSSEKRIVKLCFRDARATTSQSKRFSSSVRRTIVESCVACCEYLRISVSSGSQNSGPTKLRVPLDDDDRLDRRHVGPPRWCGQCK